VSIGKNAASVLAFPSTGILSTPPVLVDSEGVRRPSHLSLPVRRSLCGGITLSLARAEDSIPAILPGRRSPWRPLVHTLVRLSCQGRSIEPRRPKAMAAGRGWLELEDNESREEGTIRGRRASAEPKKLRASPELTRHDANSQAPHAVQRPPRPARPYRLVPSSNRHALVGWGMQSLCAIARRYSRRGRTEQQQSAVQRSGINCAVSI